MANNRDVQKRQPDVLADALQGLATPNKGKPQTEDDKGWTNSYVDD